ncbi:xenotropic and polytropic retrovirus receptor 1 [Ceratobasidium sp. AG-Ba]|nr:xenotropic and polytropic retrovirus receptor 1 [Ceratobasidium sp. AG-Ba]
MKFARYLEETQTPEWKKAYIDYRGLKKRITAIRKANESPRIQGQHKAGDNRQSSATQPSPGSLAAARRSYGAIGRTPPNAVGRGSTSGVRRTPPSLIGFSPNGTIGRSPPAVHKSTASGRMRISNDELGADFELPPAMDSVDSLKTISTSHAANVERRRAVPSRFFSEVLSAVPSRSSAFHQPTESEHIPTLPSPAAAAPITDIPSAIEPRSRRLYSFSGMRRRMTTGSRVTEPSHSPWAPASVEELLAGIGPNELAFFTAVDQELDKVDKFYSEREQDAKLKVATLKEQFNELRGHKPISDDAHQEGLWPGFLNLLDQIHVPLVTANTNNKSPDTSIKTGTPQANHGMHAGPSLIHDPDAYQRAKKRLKKAVLEFYRGLELLQNYRILNVTGFRKALKKFEKTTKIPSQAIYMKERVETRSFASGETCDQLLKDIERIYARRFEKGDEKKARARLRATSRQTTHHFSTFRSGMLLGFAAPALAMGIYYAYQEERREQIPEWAALLQVYAALSIPVLFSLLIGLNVVAWARARINFIFIFELDARTVIDPREYIELPAFLFTTLAYAFWLSFSRAGAEHVASTTWPLAWIVFTAAVLANPLRIFHRSARYWLLKTVGKLFISGHTRVEFQDFWMGDQLCSMVYTMGNLYFLVCAYTDHWHHIQQRCQLGPHWSIPIVLSGLPSFIRLVQCIRRYIDSKNHIHLVNGGKYTASIINYITYYAWRHYGSNRDFRLGIWILFATINSCYTSYWDLTMDWSVLQVKGVQYKFLRKELAYSNYVPLYYIAIITNVVIRFIWVWYIPTGGLSAGIRSFLFALLEMLRRIQWNFFRLENEHIGNADQFRVTREVPLPYVFTGEQDSDDEAEDGRRSRPVSVRLPVVGRKDREQTLGGDE